MDDAIIADGENAVPDAGRHAVRAGERAERGEQREVLGEVEAHGAHGLAAGAVEADARVDVPGEGWRVGRIVVVRGFVDEPEGAEVDGAGEAVDAPFGGRIAGGAVVVAADERDAKVGALRAPVREGADGGGVEAALVVEEVSEDDEVFGAGEFERVGESRKVGGCRAARDGNACVAEGGGLAEVGVGEEERALAGPVGAAVGQERQYFGRERRGRAAEGVWLALEESPLGRGELLSIGTGFCLLAREDFDGVASSSR